MADREFLAVGKAVLTGYFPAERSADLKFLTDGDICRGGRPCPPVPASIRSALPRAGRAAGPYKAKQTKRNFDLDIGDFTS